MPRKGHTQKRDVLADPIYNNKVVTKLINNIMLDGKRGVAQKIVYGAFDRVAAKTERPALEVFEEAMNNIMPVLEVKARRIGGATYQVPIEVKPDRRQALPSFPGTPGPVWPFPRSGARQHPGLPVPRSGYRRSSAPWNP